MIKLKIKQEKRRETLRSQQKCNLQVLWCCCQQLESGDGSSRWTGLAGFKLRCDCSFSLKKSLDFCCQNSILFENKNKNKYSNQSFYMGTKVQYHLSQLEFDPFLPLIFGCTFLLRTTNSLPVSLPFGEIQITFYKQTTKLKRNNYRELARETSIMIGINHV